MQLDKFKVQLAIALSDQRLLGDYTATEKLDGVRAVALKYADGFHLFSRQGREITGLNDVIRDLNSADIEQEVLDGELLISRRSKDASADFRKTMSITNTKGDKTGIKYHIFDVESSREAFLNHFSINMYSERRTTLNRLKTALKGRRNVTVVPTLYTGSDTSEIQKIYEDIIVRGGEGVVLNRNSAMYHFGRGNDMLKIKQQYDNDGKIVGFKRGLGRFSDSLGALEVTYKDTVVTLGTGFTDADRQYIWDNQDSLLGSIVTYKFTSETHDNRGNINLRFARFVSLRLDKNDPNFEN